jgi:hypothetical protein
MCFGRRKFEQAGKGLVQCYIDDIPAFVKVCRQWEGDMMRQARAEADGFIAKDSSKESFFYSMEELTLYTHPDPGGANRNVARSAASWARLLMFICSHVGPTGIDRRQILDVVMATLENKGEVGGRMLSPHSTIIANAAEVREAVFKSGSQWLRSQWRD